MTFGASIATCFARFADFRGRATRSEFWWFYLLNFLLLMATGVMDRSGILNTMVHLIFILPTLAAGVRRLHDTDRNGWWLLIALTLVGVIPLIVWLASKGSPGVNRYGPGPEVAA